MWFKIHTSTYKDARSHAYIHLHMYAIMQSLRTHACTVAMKNVQLFATIIIIIRKACIADGNKIFWVGNFAVFGTKSVGLQKPHIFCFFGLSEAGKIPSCALELCAFPSSYALRTTRFIKSYRVVQQRNSIQLKVIKLYRVTRYRITRFTKGCRIVR